MPTIRKTHPFSSHLFTPSFFHHKSLKNHPSTQKVIFVAGSILVSLIVGSAFTVAVGFKATILAPTIMTTGLIVTIALIAYLILSSKHKKNESIELKPLLNHKNLSSPASKEASQTINHYISQQIITESEGHLEKIADTLQTNRDQEIQPLSDPQLDQILQFIDRTRIALNYQDHYHILYLELERELGPEKAQKVFQVKGLIDRLPYPISSEVIQQVVKKANNYFYNEEIFTKLKSEGYSQDALDRIFRKLQLRDYLTGNRRLSPATQQAISACLKNEQTFESLLGEIEIRAQQDLVLDQQCIEKTFRFDDFLLPLSPQERQKRREDLKKIINQAYINRELKQKAKWVTGEADEKRLLAYLQFNVDDQSDYQNKELVYSFLETIVTAQLQTQVKTASLSLVKEVFKQCALNARLQAAGLTTPLQMAKFHMLQALFQSYKEELIRLHQTIPFRLPSNFPLPVNSLTERSLKAHFEKIKIAYTYQILGNFFSYKYLIGKQFKDEKVSSKTLKAFIEGSKYRLKTHQLRMQCLDALEKPNKSSLAKKIDFYQKWGAHIQTEMIQGFDNKDEVLGGGVCWAICQRVRFFAQQYPDITPQSLAKKFKIKAQDRYHQASYGIKFAIASENAFQKSKIPQFIQKAKFEERKIFECLYKANEDALNAYFNSHQDLLTQSCGWIELGLILKNQSNLSGHALLVRLDPIKNRYWIIDPNIGFFCFENSGIPPQEAQKECLNCLKDLISTFYPTIFQLSGNQIIKANSSP